MKQMKRTTLATFTSLAFACAAQAQTTEFSTLIPGIANDHVVLGTAYNSAKNKILNLQPVAGKVDTESFGNSDFIIQLDQDMSFTDALNILSGSLDVNVGFSKVRASAGASIAKETASTNYASSFTFHTIATPKKAVFVPEDSNVGFTLSPVGDELATNYQSRLADLAGDQFITSIEYGAQLIVNMKVEYLNDKDKSDIGGYLDVDIGSGLVEVNGKLQYLDSEAKSSVKITVRAIQKGGDPLQLLKVIPDNIVTCSLEDPTPCFTLFRDAISYAKNDYKDQFNALSDYNVINYKTTSYGKSSLELKRLDPGSLEVSLETATKTFELEENYQQAIIDAQRAADLLANSYAFMDEAQQTSVKAIETAAYDNAWLYYEAAVYCRDNPFGTSCVDYWAEIEANCAANNEGCEKQYSSTDLEIPTQSAKRWEQCDLAREAATNFGTDAEGDSFGYRNMRWAPVFVDNADPAAGVLEWAPCEFALTTYGDSFTQ